MKKRKSTYFWIMLIFLGIFLGIILFQAYTINNLTPEENIVGTYMAGNLGDAEYITLEQDGDCAAYVQLGHVKWGTYSKEDEVISMTFSDGIVSAVYMNESIYTFSERGQSIVKFQKISDIPTYTNVNSTAEGAPTGVPSLSVGRPSCRRVQREGSCKTASQDNLERDRCAFVVGK